MKTYSALLKSDAEPVLIKEGFAWGAFFFGPLWLAAHRAWIAAAISLAAYVIVPSLAPEPVGSILGIGLALILGLTGNDIRRWTLEQNGYLLTHVLAAHGRDEAWMRLINHRPDLTARYRPDPV
jgi:hypothetical protein